MADKKIAAAAAVENKKLMMEEFMRQEEEGRQEEEEIEDEEEEREDEEEGGRSSEESEEKEKVVGETEKPKDPPEAHETPAEPTEEPEEKEKVPGETQRSEIPKTVETPPVPTGEEEDLDATLSPGESTPSVNPTVGGGVEASPQESLVLEEGPGADQTDRDTPNEKRTGPTPPPSPKKVSKRPPVLKKALIPSPNITHTRLKQQQADEEKEKETEPATQPEKQVYLAGYSLEAYSKEPLTAPYMDSLEEVQKHYWDSGTAEEEVVSMNDNLFGIIPGGDKHREDFGVKEVQLDDIPETRREQLEAELKLFPEDKLLDFVDLTECRSYPFVVRQTRFVRRDNMGDRLAEDLEAYGLQLAGEFRGLPRTLDEQFYEAERFTSSSGVPIRCLKHGTATATSLAKETFANTSRGKFFTPRPSSGECGLQFAKISIKKGKQSVECPKLYLITHRDSHSASCFIVPVDPDSRLLLHSDRKRIGIEDILRIWPPTPFKWNKLFSEKDPLKRLYPKETFLKAQKPKKKKKTAGVSVPVEKTMKVAGVLKAVKVAGSLRRQAVDMVARTKVGGRKPAQENAEARGDKIKGKKGRWVSGGSEDSLKAKATGSEEEVAPPKSVYPPPGEGHGFDNIHVPIHVPFLDVHRLPFLDSPRPQLPPPDEDEEEDEEETESKELPLRRSPRRPPPKRPPPDEDEEETGSKLPLRRSPRRPPPKRPPPVEPNTDEDEDEDADEDAEANEERRRRNAHFRKMEKDAAAGEKEIVSDGDAWDQMSEDSSDSDDETVLTPQQKRKKLQAQLQAERHASAEKAVKKSIAEKKEARRKKEQKYPSRKSTKKLLKTLLDMKNGPGGAATIFGDDSSATTSDSETPPQQAEGHIHGVTDEQLKAVFSEFIQPPPRRTRRKRPESRYGQHRDYKFTPLSDELFIYNPEVEHPNEGDPGAEAEKKRLDKILKKEGMMNYHKGAFPKNDVQSLTAHPFQSTVQESWYGFRTVLTHTEYLYHALARSHKLLDLEMPESPVNYFRSKKKPPVDGVMEASPVVDQPWNFVFPVAEDICITAEQALHPQCAHVLKRAVCNASRDLKQMEQLDPASTRPPNVGRRPTHLGLTLYHLVIGFYGSHLLHRMECCSHFIDGNVDLADFRTWYEKTGFSTGEKSTRLDARICELIPVAWILMQWGDLLTRGLRASVAEYPKIFIAREEMKNKHGAVRYRNLRPSVTDALWETRHAVSYVNQTRTSMREEGVESKPKARKFAAKAPMIVPPKRSKRPVADDEEESPETVSPPPAPTPSPQDEEIIQINSPSEEMPTPPPVLRGKKRKSGESGSAPKSGEESGSAPQKKKAKKTKKTPGKRPKKLSKAAMKALKDASIPKGQRRIQNYLVPGARHGSVPPGLVLPPVPALRSESTPSFELLSSSLGSVSLDSKTKDGETKDGEAMEQGTPAAAPEGMEVGTPQKEPMEEGSPVSQQKAMDESEVVGGEGVETRVDNMSPAEQRTLLLALMKKSGAGSATALPQLTSASSPSPSPVQHVPSPVLQSVDSESSAGSPLLHDDPMLSQHTTAVDTPPDSTMQPPTAVMQPPTATTMQPPTAVPRKKVKPPLKAPERGPPKGAKPPKGPPKGPPKAALPPKGAKPPARQKKHPFEAALESKLPKESKSAQPTVLTRDRLILVKGHALVDRLNAGLAKSTDSADIADGEALIPKMETALGYLRASLQRSQPCPDVKRQLLGHRVAMGNALLKRMNAKTGGEKF